MKSQVIAFSFVLMTTVSWPAFATMSAIDGSMITPTLGYGASQNAMCVSASEVSEDVNAGRYFIRSEQEHNERNNMSSYKIVYGYAYETKKVSLQNVSAHPQFKKDRKQDVYNRLCGKFVDSVTFGFSLSFHFGGAFEGKKYLFNVDLPGTPQGLEALKALVKIVTTELKGTSNGFGYSTRGAISGVEFSSQMFDQTPEVVLNSAAKTIEANKTKIQPNVLTYSLSQSPSL